MRSSLLLEEGNISTAACRWRATFGATQTEGSVVASSRCYDGRRWEKPTRTSPSGLNETTRAHDVLVIRGGILEGNVVGDADIKRLATLPPADVLRAQLAGTVVGPLTTVVGLFTVPLRDLVGVIDARIRQLEEQSETVPEPEPAEEPQAEAPAEELEPEPEAQEETEEEASGED